MNSLIRRASYLLMIGSLLIEPARAQVIVYSNGTATGGIDQSLSVSQTISSAPPATVSSSAAPYAASTFGAINIVETVAAAALLAGGGVLAASAAGGGGGSKSTHVASSGGTGGAPDTFKVFDTMFQSGKPSSAALGLRQACMLYEWDFFHGGLAIGIPPFMNSAASACNNMNPAPEIFILDIESENYWIFHGLRDHTSSTPRTFVQSELDNMVTIIQQMKQRRTISAPMSYYGYMPEPEVYRSVYTQTPGYAVWQNENDILQPLNDEMEIFTPSIYTYDNDRTFWVQYATATLQEARRRANGRKVYPFIWYRYHESNIATHNAVLSADYWRLMLDTVYNCVMPDGTTKCADGVILWGGQFETWDPNAPWWQETVDFMADHNIIATSQ
jgi:hypothetical protein